VTKSLCVDLGIIMFDVVHNLLILCYFDCLNGAGKFFAAVSPNLVGFHDTAGVSFIHCLNEYLPAIGEGHCENSLSFLWCVFHILYFQQSVSSISKFQASWSWSRQSLPKLSFRTPVKVSFSSLCQPLKVSSFVFSFLFFIILNFLSSMSLTLNT